MRLEDEDVFEPEVIQELESKSSLTITSDDMLPERSSPEYQHMTTIFAEKDATGKTIADFKILKVLGRGSFGKVFLV